MEILRNIDIGNVTASNRGFSVINWNCNYLCQCHIDGHDTLKRYNCSSLVCFILMKSSITVWCYGSIALTKTCPRWFSSWKVFGISVICSIGYKLTVLYNIWWRTVFISIPLTPGAQRCFNWYQEDVWNYIDNYAFLKIIQKHKKGKAI